ncbi:MAG: hypothetical protein UZ05_CHB002003191 [Chlorobi bacterium OLB5]|nr:MAG: hypothetical protein UZ05_CHB002003191 [Chlorobi bacterium OLB5]
MSINHHLLAKTTTDSILANFKSGYWKCCVDVGVDFYRVGCASSFPSPDAAFYDDAKKLMVSFEFKPPTETKRGILTGLGQSIAYLNSSNLSFLIVPNKLEDYEIGAYMTDLFRKQIEESLPIGLIIYDNNSPSNVSLIHNVNALSKKIEFKSIATNRFWAKHLDMPIPLFHLLLHCYYLKKTGQINGDAFSYCWETYLIPQNVIKTLTPMSVKDYEGNLIKTLGGRKDITFLEKKIAKIKVLTGIAKVKAIEELKRDADVTIVGDNYFNSIKKNYVTFLKHLGVVDSTGSMTEEGFKLYHLGLVNGPNSKLFYDYFTQTILIKGHHLDLIFDFDNLCNQNRGRKTVMEIRKQMLLEYEAKGMIKTNPNRKVGTESTVDFLKYEFILWNSLGLLVKTNGKPDLAFNWKK